MRGSGVLARTVLVYGQMNEPPGARWRVPLTALTIAEYFRDQKHQNVLLLMDNVFRFVQAGAEISSLLGRLPSRVGYQPTLATEVAALEERIASVAGAAVTAIQAVYVPADDFTDPAVTAISSHMDSIIMLSRELAAEAFIRRSIRSARPRCCSIRWSSARHYRLAERAREALARFKDLQDIIALLGVEELGAADRLIVKRARRLQRFLSQPFVVTEAFTGTPGRSVALADTLQGCRAILDGEADDWAESSLYMVGTLDDARQKEAGRQSGRGGMRLRIVTPLAVVVDEDDILAVRAEDSSGSFGILPGHADFLTSLTTFGGQLEARRWEPALLRGPAWRVFRERRPRGRDRHAGSRRRRRSRDARGAPCSRAFTPTSRPNDRSASIRPSATGRHPADHAAFAARGTRRNIFVTPPQERRRKRSRSSAPRDAARNATGRRGAKASPLSRAGWRKSACWAG